MIVHISFLLGTKQIVASIASLYTSKIPLCTLTLIHDKHNINASPIICDNNLRNIIELDSDSDHQCLYILSPEPNKRKPPLIFIPSQIKTTIRPKTLQPKILVYTLMQN